MVGFERDLPRDPMLRRSDPSDPRLSVEVRNPVRLESEEYDVSPSSPSLKPYGLTLTG